MANASSLQQESYHFLKRVVDVILSILGLILSAPLMLTILIMVRLTSPGPIIFKQRRVGLNGKYFTLYKFRTMRVGSERGNFFTAYQDSRITWAGKIFRPFHLDELPQFWNIIKGDMSLVGPRPCSFRIYVEMKEILPDFDQKFQVMPGLTGLAQVNSQRWCSAPIEHERQTFEWDMRYIATRSLLVDLWILIKTTIVITRRSGI